MKSIATSIFLFWSLFAQADVIADDERICVIEQGQSKKPILERYSWASREDTVSLSQVLTSASLFESVDQKRLHLGNFNDYGWIKFHLTNQSQSDDFILEFDETYLDTLRAYLVKEEKVIKAFEPLGLQHPENWEREYLTVNPSYFFPLSIAKGDTITVLLYCAINKGTLQVGNTLWEKESFESRKKEIRLETNYLLLLLGFASLIILVSGTFLIFTRDVIHAYYIGFIISNVGNILLMADFFSAKKFEAYISFGVNYTDAFGLAQVYFGLQYVIHLLNVKEKLPVVHKGLRIVLWLTVFNGLMAVFLSHHLFWVEVLVFNLLTFELVFVLFSTVAIAVYLSIKGDLMAKYFVVAYTPLLYFAGHYFAIIWNLTNKERTVSWEAFIFFEIFVLTLAMAHRYYLIGKKNIEYQKQINRQQSERIKQMEAVQQERERISRDLHDSVGTHFAYIVSRLDFLYLGWDKDKVSDKKGYLTNLSDFARSGMRLLRETIWALNEEEVSADSLKAKIEDYLKLCFNEVDTSYHFLFGSNQLKINSGVALHCFRAVQETVSNCLKYAEASVFEVDLKFEGDRLVLKISDDGKGFEVLEGEAKKDHYGLGNLKKRAADLNGTFDIRSGKDGTKIEITGTNTP